MEKDRYWDQKCDENDDENIKVFYLVLKLFRWTRKIPFGSVVYTTIIILYTYPSKICDTHHILKKEMLFNVYVMRYIRLSSQTHSVSYRCYVVDRLDCCYYIITILNVVRTLRRCTAKM